MQQQQQTDFNLQLPAHQNGLQQNILHAQQRSPPREFDKGVCTASQMQIYQLEAQDVGRLTLAHGLGHALGLLPPHGLKALRYPVLG
ncbi:hypothetical protein OC498_10190 [Acinetobacter bohemicus]|uniref:hypothetical protein n=1 Tax=Acinetobacter TaxID=469 RepID=UPI001E624722|nr:MULTISPECIES: hypothetical protein [Acinetobacter]MCO8042864.1 hypothetical protein [Acinetobacter sp. S4400-12]MCU7225265.1 hypothetical protein [Acinetobacter bohemicus]